MTDNIAMELNMIEESDTTFDLGNFSINPEKNISSKRKRLNYASENRLNTFIVVIENPKFIENVSAVIRSANAFGVAKVYVIDGNNIMKKDYDTIREDRQLNCLSVSAIKWTYVKVFNTTKNCIDHLEKNGFVSIVTSPHDKNRNPSIELKNSTYTDKKLAVWFGNETHGISDEAVLNSSKCVKLDMFGMVESLNLGSCASIVMYEIANQRRNFTQNKIKAKQSK